MLSQILLTLQTMLIPLVIGLLVVGAAAVYFIGRPPTRPRPGPGTGAAPQDDDDQTLAPDTVPPPAPIAVAAPVPARVPQSVQDSAPAPLPPPPLPAPPPAALPPLTADLLLVDDSAVVRAKLRRLFEPAGYRVALARDGVEALQLLGQGRFALMVTDLEMPNLDGVGLIHAAQAHPSAATMPIMAITGHDDLQARLDECREICGIYRKPWIDEDLLGHVQTLVATRGGHAADLHGA